MKAALYARVSTVDQEPQNQLLEALGLPGTEHCRGYLQHWDERRGAEPMPERSAQWIFKAADPILKAGTDRGVPS